MLDKLYDPMQWRKRAEELRNVADGCASGQARACLLRLAADYDVLAERAEVRARAKTKAMSSV